MSWFNFGGRQEQSSTSVLAEWNKYASSHSGAKSAEYQPVATNYDVEMAADTGTSSSSSLQFLAFPTRVTETLSSLAAGFSQGRVGPAAPSASAASTSGAGTSTSGAATDAGVLSYFFSVAQNAVTGVQAGVTSVTQQAQAMPSQSQLTMFLLFEAAGVIFLTLAFTVALPVMVLAPQKFALFFTMGCMSVMAGFVALRGFRAQLQHMLARERLHFSVAYVVSMALTLYAALGLRSYLLSVIFSGGQVTALLYYVISYFPGGNTGLRMLTGFLYSAMSKCFNLISRR